MNQCVYLLYIILFPSQDIGYTILCAYNRRPLLTRFVLVCMHALPVVLVLEKSEKIMMKYFDF